MKKQVILTGLVSAFMFFGSVEQSHAQFGKFLKKAMSKRAKKSKSGRGGAKPGTFSHLNDEKDEYGLTGEYIDNEGKACGFKFVREKDGEIVNQVHYWQRKQKEPQIKLKLKENFYTKHKVKMFYTWIGPTSKQYIEVIEVAPGVLAQLRQSEMMNVSKFVPLELKRKVIDVFVKNKADKETWDIETAQAKADMLLTSLQSESLEKDVKKLMRYEAYKNYHGKIAFAKAPYLLDKLTDKKPTEKVEHFMNKTELGESVIFKPYLDKPLAFSHPGAWFNVSYEMVGLKTDREALRKTSAKFSKQLRRMDDWLKDFYFYRSRMVIYRTKNIADYAFLELIRLAKEKGKLQQGQTYDLKVTVWAFKDGENVAPVAKGTVQLEYTTNTDKLLSAPLRVYEDFLDE